MTPIIAGTLRTVTIESRLQPKLTHEARGRRACRGFLFAPLAANRRHFSIEFKRFAHRHFAVRRNRGDAGDRADEKRWPRLEHVMRDYRNSDAASERRVCNVAHAEAALQTDGVRRVKTARRRRHRSTVGCIRGEMKKTASVEAISAMYVLIVARCCSLTVTA